MKKSEVNQKTDTIINDTTESLQTVYDALNQGQRKQIIKNEKVKTLFDRYGVEYESEG